MVSTKRTAEQRTILQLVLIDETGDSYYRMRWPGAHIAQQAPSWRVISLDAQAEERFTWAREADLLIVYQSNDLDLFPIIAERKKQGKKTIIEYNDNFYAPPPASPVFEPWSSPLMWQTYETMMNQGDTVVVTGPGLKDLFSGVTELPIEILENHLPFEPLPFEKLWKDTAQGINFGWAGSIGHIADFIAVVPVLRTLLEMFPNLNLHVMGNEAIPDILKLPPERFTFTDWGPMSAYYKFWENIHLGFAPLIDTPYNRCRSDVKALEMAGLGALPVLTPLLPYKNFVEKTDAPTFTSNEELLNVLSALIKNPSDLKARAKKAYTYVAEHRLGTRRTERLALYTSLMTGEKSKFAWPMGSGYHEVQGVSKTELRHVQVAKNARELLRQKQFEEGIQLLEQEHLEQPMNPEISLELIRALRLAQSSRLKPTLEDAIRKFPKDLRFLLTQTAYQTDDMGRIAYWAGIVERLRREGTTYRTFFRPDIVRLFSRQAQQTPALVAIGSQLLEFYAESAELLYALAQAQESRGDFEAALRNLGAILSLQKTTVANADFFKNTSFSVVKSWEEALEARMKGL